MRCKECGQEIKKNIPDSTKCDKLKIKKETIAGREYTFKSCLPCAGIGCVIIFGSDFCKHHYKPRKE